jgi:hypothetical protein
MDEEEQDEDRARSKRDWLQKSEKKVTEGHGSIMGARAGGGDITIKVDLSCGRDWLQYAINKACGRQGKMSHDKSGLSVDFEASPESRSSR